jgi:hypothetical protein
MTIPTVMRGTATGTLTARAADNPAAFDGSNLPSGVAKTTATTSVSVNSTGAKSFSVTAQVQEVVNRGGWASGQAMAFPLVNTASGYNNCYFASYEQGGGANKATLSITYTAAAGGTSNNLTSNNLLLLGCG